MTFCLFSTLWQHQVLNCKNGSRQNTKIPKYQITKIFFFQPQTPSETLAEAPEPLTDSEDDQESAGEMDEEAEEEVVLTPPSNTDEEESPGGERENAKPRLPGDAMLLRLSRELNTPKQIGKRCLDSECNF